jgi:hypothetical protein
MRRWPLFLIASPAAVAIWAGWVALGGLCGFGLVQPLPGIVAWHLDTAITLPVGVEAYGAYALGAWLTPGTPDRARAFARGSAIGALVLGMLGQVIYHLLAAAGRDRAPWPVVVLVSCMPVMTLGFGAALTHLLFGPRTDARTDAGAAEEPMLEVAGEGLAQPPAAREVIISDLAEQIRNAMAAGERWQPDYPALMAATGYQRSWCEKAVREARTVVFLTGVQGPELTASLNGHASEN